MWVRMLASKPAAVREYALTVFRPSLWYYGNAFLIGGIFVAIGGWLPVHRRTRRPYPPVTEPEMAELRRATHELMPELVSYKP